MKRRRLEPLPVIRPGVLPWATVALASLAASVWHTSGPAGWELPVIALLRHAPFPMQHSFVLLWQPVPFAIATLLVAWVAFTSDRPQLAVSGTLGCVGALLVTERILKPLIGRHDVNGLAPMFPSGHVTAAAAWAMFAWLVIDPRSQVRSLLILVPVMAGWGVVSEQLHYPADAVAGLLVGGVVVYGVCLGVDRLTSATRGLTAARDADRAARRSRAAIRTPS